ncbi:ATP-binding protein [Rhizobium leguminosarum]|uniref:ATP-binding protein n=1 Tax=Rhizobium leguminosarum TaxID=384 RepID=UPI003F9B9EB0
MTPSSLALRPADMVAVIARTNLHPNPDNFLLPMFESISNAYHSISDRFGAENISKGHIFIDVNKDPASIIVKDNGTGLDEDSMESFRTPFTGQKLKRGGKGFGRFISFKVFDDILYQSRHKGKSGNERFSFRFDINVQKEEISFIDPFTTSLEDYGCCVSLSAAKPNFQTLASALSDDQIIDRIIRYFLPYFLSGRMPQLEIYIDGLKHDPEERFRSLFSSQEIIKDKIEIDGQLHDFEIGISLSEKGSLFPRHAMLLFADDRIIGSGRSIEGKIGTPHFTGTDGKSRVVVASVSGEFLNIRANTARTDIEASEDEIDEIANHVSQIVLDKQGEYREQRRGDQAKSLSTVFLRNPLLRTALTQNVADYVRSKPMNWGAEQFVSDLALKRFRDQGRWEKELQEKTKDYESLKSAREEILAHIEQENKEALASYVAHRRTVIDLAEKIIGVQDSNGSTSLEDVIHDIVYPRHTDSENTKFYQHNLWMLDERLAFVSYVSSDRTVHGGRRQAGDKVADLIMFDECAVFNDSDSNSLVLVEFKRPGRNDYKFGDVKRDPIQQVFETIGKIRQEKSLVTSSGTRLNVPGGTRIYSYIVADIEPTLLDVVEDHDFDATWDQQGYYRYHDKRDAFVEVFGYNKLVSDAKKRNSAFFDVLIGDLI